MAKEKLVVLGKLGAFHGVHGWMRLFSATEKPANIFTYDNWLLNLNGKMTPVKVEGHKTSNGEHFLVKLNIANTKEEAQALTNSHIYYKASDLPQLEEGEYYWKDLTGCTCYTPDGYELGTVKEIMETGANDVLVLTVKPGDKYGKTSRLIPFLPDHYEMKVDVAAKKITVDWDPDF